MRTRSLTLATLALLTTVLAAARAQPASMLLDLGKEPSFASPLGSFDRIGRTAVELDGVLYFRSNDNIHGVELWRTAGTAASTLMLQDTCPGLCSSLPAFLTAFRHKMYWTAFDGLHNLLFASDGTPRGTGPAFGPGSSAASHSLAPLGEAGGRLLLSGLSADGSKGELWVTDGTAFGTVRLRSFRVPASPSAARPSLIGRAGGFLVFSIGSQTQRESLWATDGTAAGTVQLNAGAPGVTFTGNAFAPPVVALGGRLFFEAFGTTGGTWVSDGTAAGTHPLAGVESNVAAVGSQLFFFRTTAGGRALWKSDATLAGATLVKDFSGLPEEGSPGGLFAAGHRLFFWGSRDLWVSDGTEAGTRPAWPLPGPQLGRYMFAVGDRLGFFLFDGFHDFHPWVSDGTAAGTYPVAADLLPGSGMFSGLGVLGGRWFFDARDRQGWFLWSTDGSPDSLTKVAPLDLQTSPFLSPLADLNGTMLFFSGEPGTDGVTDLWRSDGSAGGTFQVDRLVPVRGFDGTLPPTPLALIGDRLFFSYDFALWVTDGTAAGTLTVPATSNLEVLGLDGAAKIGGSLYFIASGTGEALVKTDGTEAGTTILHSFDRGLPEQRAVVGNRLFFSVSIYTDPVQTSLWTSDGTAAGTKPVDTGHVFQHPAFWAALGSSLLFSNVDAAGIELWASDGTAAGTRRLNRITPLKPGQPSFNLNYFQPGSFAFAGGRVFFAGDDGIHGRELWVSDGTAAGTRMLADIARGASGSSVASFAAVGNRVFFAADDGVHGRELWVTNGTAAGTRLVADIVPGARSSYLGNLAGVGGLLLFSADDGVHGHEPWVSDGTRAGTRMVQDVAPGPLPSNPSGFFLSGHEIYFIANDATHGFEIWNMPREALTENP